MLLLSAHSTHSAFRATNPFQSHVSPDEMRSARLCVHCARTEFSQKERDVPCGQCTHKMHSTHHRGRSSNSGQRVPVCFFCCCLQHDPNVHLRLWMRSLPLHAAHSLVRASTKQMETEFEVKISKIIIIIAHRSNESFCIFRQTFVSRECDKLLTPWVAIILKCVSQSNRKCHLSLSMQMNATPHTLTIQSLGDQIEDKNRAVYGTSSLLLRCVSGEPKNSNVEKPKQRWTVHGHASALLQRKCSQFSCHFVCVCVCAWVMHRSQLFLFDDVSFSNVCTLAHIHFDERTQISYASMESWFSSSKEIASNRYHSIVKNASIKLWCEDGASHAMPWPCTDTWNDLRKYSQVTAYHAIRTTASDGIVTTVRALALNAIVCIRVQPSRCGRTTMSK